MRPALSTICKLIGESELRNCIIFTATDFSINLHDDADPQQSACVKNQFKNNVSFNS